MEQPATHLRLAAHFFPKFDNQGADECARLCSGSDREALVQNALLAVTKKHSGSLVMAPPFYSKNGTANIFSRTAAWLLHEHFLSAYDGDEGDDAFRAWWADAEGTGLCHSFEVVCPSFLGEHGATPRCAYVVLTAIAATREGRFLSPVEVLRAATRWRLPINECWYFPLARGRAVEDALHSARWEAGDAEVTALLDAALAACGSDEAARCGFLSHGETQGEVLEGMVMLRLRGNVSGLTELARSYTRLMAPWRMACITAALAAGQRCARHDPALAALVGAPLQYAPEPVRMMNIPDAALWQFGIAAPGKLGALFRCLRRSYAHHVVLKAYEWRGERQIQIQILCDEIFYGWRTQQITWGAAPLFRGMVVQTCARSSLVHTAALAAATVEIEAISKLKCLRYLLRTFGVRNLLKPLIASCYLFVVHVASRRS